MVGLTKKITLARPFEMFKTTVRELELREPTGQLYSELGDPVIVMWTASGSAYPVEQREVINTYLDKLITHEAGSAVLALLSLEDTKALKAALLSFFSEAEARNASRRSTPSSSSSE